MVENTQRTCNVDDARNDMTTQNLPNAFAAALFFATRITLNRTVFDSGRHWPVQSRTLSLSNPAI